MCWNEFHANVVRLNVAFVSFVGGNFHLIKSKTKQLKAKSQWNCIRMSGFSVGWELIWIRADGKNIGSIRLKCGCALWHTCISMNKHSLFHFVHFALLSWACRLHRWNKKIKKWQTKHHLANWMSKVFTVFFFSVCFYPSFFSRKFCPFFPFIYGKL